MPVGRLLELVSNVEQLRFGKVGAQNLQAYRAATGKACGNANTWDASQVDGDGVVFLQLQMLGDESCRVQFTSMPLAVII